MTKEERARIARENGAKSNGPVTSAGKERSARIALKDRARAEKFACFIPPHQAIRCTVARTLTGESFRDFGCRLPESMPLQSFCKLDRIDTVRIPGKSALRRYGQWLPEEEMRKVTGTLLGAAASAVEDTGAQTLALTGALNWRRTFSTPPA